MAKKKSQKKAFSSAENPFNIKVNRSKHSVLGQKLKGTRGKPGVSHALGNAKRKEEFHKKRIHSQKANKFLDKRLMDNSLSYEEHATLRLVEERKKKFKKNIFNLNDEVMLTHKGVPLEFQSDLNVAVDDSDDDEKLDSKFVKYAHFGGFADDSASTKSRKEIIDELIHESKKRKMERKLEKEKNEDLIEKLDQEWREMHHVIPAMTSKQSITTEKNVDSEKYDPFDVFLKELRFDKRVSAGPKKTPEELAREEREKVKKLEEDQYKRMMDPMDNIDVKNELLSADSIYDGLDIQFEPIDDQESTNVTFEKHSDVDESDVNSSDSEDENECFDKEEINDTGFIAVTTDNSSDVPKSLEEFHNLIDNRTEELYTVVENILKDKIKSRSKQNLEKLETFFAILLEFIMNSDSNSKTLDILDDMLVHFYALAQFSPVNTAEKILAVLDKEQELFQQSKGKKLKKQFPRFQSLVLFKIISSIYSVSDFKHPVVTPAVVFMCDILSSAYSITFQNTYYRIFISKIIYDCVSLSKRYVPEVFWFLNKALELAIDNTKQFHLFIDEAVKTEERSDINFEKTYKSCDSDTKVSIMFEIIQILHKFCSLYEQLQCHTEIFSDSLNISKQLPIANYPNFLKEAVSEFIASVENVKNTYKPLVFQNKKPVPLKLFEPAFESKYTKKDDIKRKKKIIKHVNQKIKKEQKGMLREMRRNNQVIASEKLKERMEADEERKRKVKQLYAELSMQEGEYKKFMKKK